MRFAWSDRDRSRWSSESHRGRYLHCNALMNPPAQTTPLYTCQYVGYAICPIYATPVESLAIFAVASTYYVTTTFQLEESIGRWDKPYPPSGPDPQLRYNQPRYLWQQPKGSKEIARLQAMSAFGCPTLVQLFDHVVRKCNPMDGIPATLSARDLRNVVPRPANPGRGLSLGTPTTTGASAASAEAPSRKGMRKRRRSQTEPAGHAKALEGGLERGEHWPTEQ